MLAGAGRREQRKIAAKIDGLDTDPETQGKPLRDELTGDRSVKAAGRYRVLYRIDEEGELKTVTIVAVGIRREGDKNDVYSVAENIQKGNGLDA